MGDQVFRDSQLKMLRFWSELDEHFPPRRFRTIKALVTHQRRCHNTWRPPRMKWSFQIEAIVGGASSSRPEYLRSELTIHSLRRAFYICSMRNFHPSQVKYCTQLSDACQGMLLLFLKRPAPQNIVGPNSALSDQDES